MTIVTANIQPNRKKYECRTGSFEGSFVSSVEFCKHVKFDEMKETTEIIIKQVHKDHLAHRVFLVQQDHKAYLESGHQVFKESGYTRFNRSKWNTRPTWSSRCFRDNFSNSSNAYQLAFNIIPIPPGSGFGTLLLCDLGDTVISGGYNLENTAPFSSVINVLDNHPSGLDGWFVNIVYSNATGASAQMTIIANCFDNPPPHIP